MLPLLLSQHTSGLWVPSLPRFIRQGFVGLLVTSTTHRIPTGIHSRVCRGLTCARDTRAEGHCRCL